MTRQDVRDAFRQVRLSREEKAAMLENMEQQALEPEFDEEYGVQMKKSWGVWLLIAGVVVVGLITLCLVLASSKRQNIPVAPGQTETPSSQETQETLPQIPELYLEKLQQISQGRARGEDAGYFVDLGLSGLYANGVDVGYTLSDLDGNGVQELLISDGSRLYDVFTLENGTLVRVLTGAERDRYQLIQSGLIFNTASNSAFETIYSVYELSGSVMIQEYVLKAQVDAQDKLQWYADFDEHLITEAEAEEFLNTYAAGTVPMQALP